MDTVLTQITAELLAATAAKKCHRCGCFHDAVTALETSDLAPSLSRTLERARATFDERQYDCLGCEICWPADALNAAEEEVPLPTGTGCPTAAPERRNGWPTYPGDYRVMRFTAPVAVCTLHSCLLVNEVAELAPAGLSIVGSLQTENLGIERIIENVVANPHIRFLLICGQDTQRRIGHYPGQSLIAMAHDGITGDRKRIVGATGKRPLLRNIDAVLVAHFRRQVQIVDQRGLTEADEIAKLVEQLAARDAGPMEEEMPSVGRQVRVLRAARQQRLLLDPAGYVVIFSDPRHRLLIAEHYQNSGVLHMVIEGSNAIDVMATLLREGLVTRLDHAAYLGRELSLAEKALNEGTLYVQDQAPGQSENPEPGPAAGAGTDSCGCPPGCGDST